eukprot:CAMPEP_0201283518 /NCGR_PEP_ID=MMETSP1317-20130820/8754_1 /ASSEMBLY_ACC=CAM_ASM_000770 /TAXON_ID=187299 /ORGANISM="Undescribed Undescribed, Strain Undescribed" /LENGTH=107 /DNA_ID=CAMNT_0047600011 /DNA_START=1314 /DNA_END=1640 /DNA_ORIENTATION=+
MICRFYSMKLSGKQLTIVQPICLAALMTVSKFSLVWKMLSEGLMFIFFSSMVPGTALLMSLHSKTPDTVALNKSSFSMLRGSICAKAGSFSNVRFTWRLNAYFSASE